MKTLKDVIITKEYLHNWNVYQEHFEFFVKTFGDKADLETILKKCEDKEWKAWLLYITARHIPNERYTPEIIEELIKTNEAYYLCIAAINLSNKRYTPKLLEALLETGNMDYICEAALCLSDDRIKDLEALQEKLQRN